MSIQSEINRIAGAKSDIADAIEDKGVTVPSGTKLDGMANLIGQISGSGSEKLNSTQAADAYDPTATYAVGDKVSYAGDVYSCISAISTPEAWDSTHWDQVNPIQDQVDEVKNTLNSEIATRQTYVRPNLLDNWYFIGGGSQLGDGVFPINQRGQTTYSGTGYGIDRWRSDSNLLDMEILSDYISINLNRMGMSFRQNCNKIGFVGNTVTFSVLAKGENIRLTISAFNNNSFAKHFISENFNGDGNTFKVYSVTAIIDSLSSTESLAVCLYSSTSESSPVLYKAVKLELGSDQTLAHNEGTEENPIWVLNEIPDYGEQLRRCQRYLYRYNCSTPHFTSTDTYMMIPIVHDFASVPSSIVKSADISWYRIDGVQTTITNKTLGIADATVNSLNIKLTPTPAPGSSNKNKLGYITRLNVLVSAEQ